MYTAYISAHQITASYFEIGVGKHALKPYV